jgi:hypothetical protein
MKNTVAIIILILVLIFGGLLIVRGNRETTAVAPTTDTVMPAPVTTSTGTSTAPATTTDAGRVKGPEQKTIAIGASGELAGMIIKINSLGQDSRCPTKVQCIQAGSVTLKTTVSKGKIVVDHEFITTAAPFVFEGYSIAIVNVTPVPTTSTGAIKLADYRVTFEATPTAKGDNI